MSKTLSLTALQKLAWVYQNSDGFGLPGEESYAPATISRAFTTGTGTDQVNRLWRDIRTLSAASTNDDLDLAGGLVDIFGEALIFTKIKAIVIANLGSVTTDGTYDETTGDNILIGGAGAGANAWGGMFNGDQDAKISLGPGGVFQIFDPVDGWAVTAGTGDILRIAYDGASENIEYSIAIAGIC